MILLDIKEYIRQHGQVSLQDVAVKFELTENAAAQMLTHWERKGKIERIGKKGCSCCSCGSANGECASACGAVYQWKEEN